jgi:signal transduction histidine kinase
MVYELNSFILVCAFAIEIALAVYLAVKDRWSATNLSFSAVLISLAIWAISFVSWAVAKNLLWIKFWINMTFFAPSLMAALFLYFAIVFPNKEFIKTKHVLISVFLPAVVFGVASFTSLIAKNIAAPYIEPMHGDWFLLFSIYFVAFLAYSFYIILKKYIRSNGKEKLQIQYLMLGSLISGAIGIFSNIYLVAQGFINIGPIMVNTVGPASATIMAGFIAYAIVKDKLLDIDNFLSRGTVYLSIISFIIGSIVLSTSGQTAILVPFYIILANLTLGFYILFQNIRSEINISFCALTICFVFWIYSAFMLKNAVSPSEAIIWGKLIFLGPILMPFIFTTFVMFFPRRIKMLSRLQKIMILLPPAILLFLLPANPSIYGIGHTFFYIYLISYLAFSLYIMFIKYKISVGIENMQIRYLFMGVIITSFLLIATNSIMPILGNAQYAENGPLFTIIFVASTAYAIKVHRLLSIEYIIEKGLIYLALSSLFTSFFIIAGLLSGYSLGDIINNRLFFIALQFILLASVIYQPALMFIQKIADKLLSGRKYDYQKTLLGMSHDITSVIRLKELINLIISNFLSTIKVKEISFIIFDDEKQKYKSAPCDIKTEGRYKKIEFDIRSPIAHWLKSNKDILVRDEIESEIDKNYFPKTDKSRFIGLQHLRDELERLGMAVWIPVISKDKMTAIICLGYKQAGDMYTDEDIGLFKTVANHVAVALENSVMYSTIAKQYEELKLTKDKLSQADKLASLGSMAAGMAHEIKNPLSSMKVFSQLLHDRYDDPEFRKKFIEIMPKEISRIDRIVEGLLSFARSPEPQLFQVDIKEIMDEVLEDLKGNIEKTEIKVTKKIVPTKILADKDQLSRAFLNIILNAIQAMPGGGSLIIETSVVESPARSLVVRINDTGHGISQDHLKHIFDPFFTTKHYGTGLGLAITHGIITAHKGAIDIESHVDAGTSVTITLPLV